MVSPTPCALRAETSRSHLSEKEAFDDMAKGKEKGKKDKKNNPKLTRKEKKERKKKKKEKRA
jgi:hypothetical protein